jgi:hypothetical protein
MKPLQKALVCGTLFLCAAQVQASRVSGEVVQGDVLVQAPDGSWQKGLPLVPGAQVRAEKEAVVSLGQSLVKLSPDSEFLIKSLDKDQVELNLSTCRGRIFVQVPSGSKLTAAFDAEQVASGDGQFTLGYGRALGLMTFAGDVAASKGVSKMATAEDWENDSRFAADSDQTDEPDEPTNDDEAADVSDDRGYYIAGGVAGAVGLGLLLGNSPTSDNLFIAPASP